MACWVQELWCADAVEHACLHGAACQGCAGEGQPSCVWTLWG